MTKDPVILMEVALEAINRERIAIEREANAERKKPAPCLALVTYLESQIDALRLLSRRLDLVDTEAVNMIIDRFIFSRQKPSAKKELAA